MTAPEIIAALTPYTGHFPEAAVQAAMAQREEVTPYLLRALEDVTETPEKFASSENMLHLFASYLLAQFRDKRAYRSLTKILATPGNTADDLFGDTVTERLDNILASVYDGDPEPIKRLVEGEDVYEFVRGAAVDTFMVLAHTGQIPREEVVDYYRSLFRGKLVRECNQVWNALGGAVADLPAPELIEDLRKAFDEDLLDPDYAELADLEQDARVPFEQKNRWKREKLSQLVSDAVSEMSWWVAFAGEKPVVQASPLPGTRPDKSEDHAPEASPSLPKAPPSPVVRPGPKIGRNDPCPCGSGKKYKKCCLGK